MSSPLKAVVDHHVDRPGVEAPRGVQLTGTNRLIGLIALIADAHRLDLVQASDEIPSCGDLRSFLTAGHEVSSRQPRFVLSFAGLVALARSLNPIPSRTRPLNSSAPMVLCLKTWESRSSPGLPRTIPLHMHPLTSRIAMASARILAAGWSSPVARQAHNLKAAGSNPAPATNDTCAPWPHRLGAVCVTAATRFLSEVGLRESPVEVDGWAGRRRQRARRQREDGSSPRLRPAFSSAEVADFPPISLPEGGHVMPWRVSGQFGDWTDVAPLSLIQFEVRSGPSRGPGHEAQPLLGRADHRRS